MYGLTVHFDSTEGALVPKVRKGFRFNPQLYSDFKQLAAKKRLHRDGPFEGSWRMPLSLGLFFRQQKLKPQS